MSISSRTARAVALFAALTPALLPSTALACWDGMAITTDKVVIAIETDARWSPEEARHWAKWVARIDALVPEGKTLSVTHGYVQICTTGGACEDVAEGWEHATAFTLFERTAALFDASGSAISDARHMHAVPLTVQVAASRDLQAAEKLAARINAAELGVSGFFDAGGFPSANASAHVVESFAGDDVVFHVVVGAFLEKREAESAARTLEQELGVQGFVRTLDQSSISEEGC